MVTDESETLASPIESGEAAAGAVTEKLRRDYYQRGYWRDESLWASIESMARRRGSRFAFVDGETSLSFDRMLAEVRVLASGLHELGVLPGQIVLIHGRNGIPAALALLACAYLGAVMTPVPPMFSATQLSVICKSASASLVIALGDDKEVATALSGAREAGCVNYVIVPDHYASQHQETRSWASIKSSSPIAAAASSADALALLVYSSGTTGAPKGVMHSANTVRYAVEQRAQMHGVTSDDIALVASQFGFVGSIVFGLLAGPLLGVTSVLMRTWRGDDAVRLLVKHRITYGLLMPTHVHDVLSSPLLEEADVSAFKRCSMGGLTRERRLEVRRRLCPNPFPVYGMSECLGFTSCKFGDDDNSLLGSDGYPFSGTEARIVDNAGQILPAGQAGHIWVRGPSRFLGYYAAPEISAKAIDHQGYFNTGDVGRLDENGCIHYVAREKDMIRRGGVTIVPGDLEAVLSTHPNIEHVAIIGLPDSRLGERACACVIPRAGAVLTLEELCSYLEENGVARYTWPERLEHFSIFPRSASLKVQKSVLVERLLGMSTP